MNDIDPIEFRPSHSTGHPGGGRPVEMPMVSFSRRELDAILRVYGLQVAANEWRDYAIDMMKDKAVFSVFRRASEVPLYRVEKNPRLARKQGAFSVISATGHILKRGRELDKVLRVLQPKPKLTTL